MDMPLHTSGLFTRANHYSTQMMLVKVWSSEEDVCFRNGVEHLGHAHPRQVHEPKPLLYIYHTHSIGGETWPRIYNGVHCVLCRTSQLVSS